MYANPTIQTFCHILNKNNDQYQLIAIGLSYHFGSKNYRFKKQNTCPAQQ